ncbi:MAG: T9SS type A sorting domain-containing protein [Flavobacteriales bacterium]|nr:T9SS type A sorting domain-containing protein [Flavobacteriales bacterium]
MIKITPFTLLLLLISSATQAQTATWNDNIACIVYTRCTGCHNDGGIAPFSLMTYGDAAAAAFGIQQAVNSGNMPPWPPDPTYRSFAHERVLTPQEIDLINNWVNNGMPEGNGVAPMAPVYTTNEEITSPDLVITMPNFTVSTIGNDVYQCFVIPSGLLQDRYIKEIEVVPGNREAVHHVLLYQDVSTTPAALDAAAPGPGYTSFGGTGSNTSVLIGGWVPGQSKKVYPGSMGVKIPAGASIVMQVHYPTTANGQQDQTKVNIRYTSGTVREVSIAPPLHHAALNEGALIIPADQTRTFTANYLVPAVNITLLDVAAHMHLLGKSIRAWAVTPLGVTIPLIDIPDWDFHWQGFYDFRQPVKIPAGSMLYSTATYDNTTSNPNNPNNPPQLVTVGEATTDEMMLVYFSYTVHYPGDENIVIDTSTTVQTYNNCDFNVVGVADSPALKTLSTYPNPTVGSVRFSLPEGMEGMVRVTDITGRTVMTQRLSDHEVDLSGLVNGLYHLTIETEGGSSTSQVLLQR